MSAEVKCKYYQDGCCTNALVHKRLCKDVYVSDCPDKIAYIRFISSGDKPKIYRACCSCPRGRGLAIVPGSSPVSYCRSKGTDACRYYQYREIGLPKDEWFYIFLWHIVSGPWSRYCFIAFVVLATLAGACFMFQPVVVGSEILCHLGGAMCAGLLGFLGWTLCSFMLRACLSENKPLLYKRLGLYFAEEPDRDEECWNEYEGWY